MMGALLGTTLAFDLSAAVHYVNANSVSPGSPYSTWSTAAARIQDAVDVATNGDQILVTNGTYQLGGRVVYGPVTNRVALTKPVTLQSVNGPAVTSIRGNWVPGTTNGDAAIRCVYMTNGAALIGFTLNNGATRAFGDLFAEQSGGGVWCESSGALISNCVLSANSAYSRGGGAYNGTFLNCTFIGNSGFLGGAAYEAVLTNCVIASNLVPVAPYPYGGSGGGAYSCTMANCLVISNSAVGGGGVANGVLVNCTITNNFAKGGGGAAGAVLTGCVLAYNSVPSYSAGGGASGGVLNNCVVTNNSGYYGGGVSGSTLSNCFLAYNYAISGGSGGGAENSILFYCILTHNSGPYNGGGAENCNLVNCILTNNSATWGGGVAGCNATNCVLMKNSATLNGGGSYAGALVNCTLVGNTAANGGGANYSALYNSIVYYNNATNGPNYYNNATFRYCCTTPAPPGVANIIDEPLFVDQAAGNFRLQPSSPCINGGNNSSIIATYDYDGNARITGSLADMGAFEFQSPGSVLPYYWLQSFGLQTDGSDDFADTDGDGMNNWREWVTGTDPIDETSVLKLLMPVPDASGITLSWQSLTGKRYYLQRSADLGQSIFSTIRTNISGQAGITTFLDTSATNAGPYFYRVGVQ